MIIIKSFAGEPFSLRKNHPAGSEYDHLDYGLMSDFILEEGL